MDRKVINTKGKKCVYFLDEGKASMKFFVIYKGKKYL